MRRAVFVLLSLALTALAAPTFSLEAIPWQEGRALSWEDFRGPPPADPQGKVAELALELRVTWETRLFFSQGTWWAQIVRFSVENLAIPSRSWVLPEKKTPEVLAHEQGHFDIQEVYRRILERKLAQLVREEFKVSGGSQSEALDRLESKIRELLEKVQVKNREVQDLYDRDTQNDLQKQREWEMRIREWLLNPDLAPRPWNA